MLLLYGLYNSYEDLVPRLNKVIKDNWMNHLFCGKDSFAFY